MATLNLNMPRYFIHAHLGDRQLGIYSAMAYATIAMVLLTDSMGHSAIPRLSRFYGAGRFAEYRSLLLRMVGAALTVGLAGLAVVQFLGIRLLTLFYGKEYAAQYRVFRILILATAIHCAACMFTSAITAARNFRIQVPLYALVVGANALTCALLIPKAGLSGGASAMVVAAAVQLIVGAAVVGRLLWTPHWAGSSRDQSGIRSWEAYES
jgi:O-antigen/teichoic acid export membrane protein